MRRSTWTEEDLLFGRTSDTSTGDWLKGGNTESCNSMGGTLQRKWLDYFTLKSDNSRHRSRTSRVTEDSEVDGGKPVIFPNLPEADFWFGAIDLAPGLPFIQEQSGEIMDGGFGKRLVKSRSKARLPNGKPPSRENLEINSDTFEGCRTHFLVARCAAGVVDCVLDDLPNVLCEFSQSFVG